MTTFQFSCLIVYGLVSLFALIKGLDQAFKKNNSFGQPNFLFWLGIFVWADALILGLFWCLVSLVCFLLQDWLLFLLIISVFWTVRSLGEIIYWLNQQFSPIIRNPPKNLLGFSWLKNDSIWFIYQLFWQCIMVVSIVSLIFLINLHHSSYLCQ